jgi:hypothetical protein
VCVCVCAGRGGGGGGGGREGGAEVRGAVIKAANDTEY